MVKHNLIKSFDKKNYIESPWIQPEKLINIEKIYSIYYFSYSKTFQTIGESHPFYELVYCDTGEVTVTDNTADITLEAGSGFIHPQNHVHKIRSNNKISNIFIIGFNGELEIITSCIGKKVVFSKPEKDLVKHILSETKSAFSDSLNTMMPFAFTPNPSAPLGSIQLIASYIESILIFLVRKNYLSEKIPQKEEAAKNHYNAITASIIEYLNDNIYNKITLANIADKVKYSSSYVKRIFKEATNESVMHYFLKLKIKKAKELLSDSTLLVKDIADILGFYTPEHFSMQFKNFVYMSPTAYRNAVFESDLLI